MWDNRLPIEERLDYLLKELTLEEKIACLSTGCPAVERLGIKATHVGGEAAHGIEARHDQAFNAGEPDLTTSFTQPIGMSASFDRELIRECGRCVGEEARALFGRNERNSLCRWAPTIDMERDPRWGRTEEAYGEDPYLTGEMSSAYIQGLKGEDPFYIQCGATLKHFYANNVEKDRIRISSSLDERNKYEYYLEPFRKAVMEGGAEAIMTSYNEINGVPAILNGEVQCIVKDQWRLPGHVVCDGSDFQQTVYDHKYFTSHAQTLAYGLKAGVDCFTDNRDVVFAAAREALEQGLITEEDIDRSIRNSFRTRIRLGYFDGDGDCPYNGMGEEFINNKEHQEICRKMAGEAVVLLKNENQALPLDQEDISSLAVVGPLADVWYKDWYGGIPPYRTTVLQGIKEAFPQTEVRCHDSLSQIRLKCQDRYVGLDEAGRLMLTEETKAETFTFTDWGCGSTTLAAESNGLFVTLEEGSYLIKADKKEVFSWFVRESWNFKPAETEGQYYLDSWNGRAVTIDPEGYLAVIKTGDVRPGEGDDEKLGRKSYALMEGEPVLFEMEIVKDGLEEAAKIAKTADRVIVVLGCNPVINSKEEIDRTTLELPPVQNKLVDRILSVNPRTIVVLVTNYPYAINSLDEKVPAILVSASGSQDMGNGIADVLSGKVSPAGRLPMTWYKADEDLPDINDYDIIAGGRTYQYFEGEVLYPFGHGLSYTEFSYGNMKLETVAEGIKVNVSVTNMGKVSGDEVVQLYVHKDTSRVKQPIRQLKGFLRIKDVQPKETRNVEFLVKFEDLRYYDVISRSMILEASTYTFMVGASSADIRQTASVYLAAMSKEKLPAGRDPFKITYAVQYDAYENCFVHRGTKGHTMEGSTCIIPGKPGDEPDAIADGLKGCVSYKDFLFEKMPERAVLRVCAVEDGEILLFCARGDRAPEDGAAALHKEGGIIGRIPVKRSEDMEFVNVEAVLPEGFIDGTGNYELQIEVNGKIKVAEFTFL